jgi:hypothetical protein
MTTLQGGVSEKDNHILLSVFDIATDWSVELNSDITDYYVEDNTAVQDHIALKPKMVTISGYQGELVTRTEQDAAGFGLSAIKKGQVVAGIMENIKNVNVQKLAQKMDVLNPLNPILPPQVAQVRAKISQATNAFDKYRSLINQDYQEAKKMFNSAKQAIAALKGNKLRGKSVINYPESLQMDRQAYIFAKFTYLWNQKILCFVDTPWGTFQNMAIQTISVNQDEETKHITNVTITFKQMQFTKPKYEKFDSANFASSTASAQHSEMTEMGKTQGKQPDQSMLLKLETGQVNFGQLMGFN